MMIEAQQEAYCGQIIPSLMICALLAWIERSLPLKKSYPGSGLVRPLLIYILMIPCIFWGILPIYEAANRLFTQAAIAFLTYGKPLFTTFFGGFHNFLLASGFHYSIQPVVVAAIQAQGYDDFFGPASYAAVSALAGALTAYLVINRKKKNRPQTAASLISTLFGASEPAIFGLFLKNREVQIGSTLGGALGGLIAGLLPMRTSGAAPVSILSISLYAGETFGRFAFMLAIATLSGFFITCLLLKNARDNTNPAAETSSNSENQ